MNNNLTTYCVTVVLVLICMIPIFIPLANAAEEILEPSSNDLWNCLSEFQESSDLYDMLSSEGWINDDYVTFLDFDYILVMADQICTMNPNVRLELVLAMIAVESRFDAYAEHAGARGLMQLMMATAKNRMKPFVEEGHEICEDDCFDVRLNLATGIDYINYILDETGGDEAYALMWYNQGPISASKDYFDRLYISEYATTIKALADKIKPYLITGRVE